MTTIPEYRYTCLSKVTGIYKGKCGSTHWNECIAFNKKKENEEYDKYLSREYLNESTHDQSLY